MTHFNAILIGGPPHSGKSVLTYSLTQALRDLQDPRIDHYVLRACPDGEGDWSNEATPETVQMIRQKGRFTSEFVRQVVNDLSRRHLPLLVDVGGRPQPEQEIIFAHCTHAILIAQDEEGLAAWRPIVERNGLSIIAELLSLREGEDKLLTSTPVLRAHLTGLERHSKLQGDVFTSVVACVTTYLREPHPVLSNYNLNNAPTELAIDLGILAGQFGAGGAGGWTPTMLPALLDYLPAGVSLSLYGRGPNWLFAAVAVHTQAEPFYQFDARRGWVKPTHVLVGAPSAYDQLNLELVQCAGYQLLKMMLPQHYIDYDELVQTGAPQVDPEQGLVLYGKAPLWLVTGMAIACRNQPWLAVYQPKLGDNAVVVASHTDDRAIGDLVALERVGA